jgi:hypothetical protein
VDRLDQLFARSLREIQAHAGELAETETGGFLVNEAAQLLAALRAQIQYRSDQVVREILEAVNAVSLEQVADDLRALGGRDARAARPSTGRRSRAAGPRRALLYRNQKVIVLGA